MQNWKCIIISTNIHQEEMLLLDLNCISWSNTKKHSLPKVCYHSIKQGDWPGCTGELIMGFRRIDGSGWRFTAFVQLAMEVQEGLKRRNLEYRKNAMCKIQTCQKKHQKKPRELSYVSTQPRVHRGSLSEVNFYISKSLSTKKQMSCL